MGIIHQAEGVDLLPANIELSGLEVTLVNTMSRETILHEYLNSVREQYDVILLDCCPSLGMLTINALAAADEVVIPMQAHYLSIKGLEQLIHTISKVKLKINPHLDIAGILITMADMRTNYSREIVDLLRNMKQKGTRKKRLVAELGKNGCESVRLTSRSSLKWKKILERILTRYGM